MLRKDIKMRIARDKRGYITTGNRGKEDNENPRSYDYFNLNDFPELQAVYGEKPTQILIVFPTDNLEDFYSTEYSLWGTGKGGMKVKKRSCDGETCVDCITREESPCLCANLPERECKCYMELKAFIINPHTGTIINFSPTSFKSHSVNSADAIYSQLEQIWIMTGGKIRGIPFLLSVQMVEKLNEKSQKTKFPIWSIQVATDINRALQYAKIAALPTTEQNRLAIDATMAVEETPALPQGNGKQSEPDKPEPKKPKSPRELEAIEKYASLQLKKAFAAEERDFVYCIKQMLWEMAGEIEKKDKTKRESEAGRLLYQFSTFEGDDGNMVDGFTAFDYLETLLQTNPKRLKTLYGIVKTKYLHLEKKDAQTEMAY